jgi:gp16 family phage-associated protein
MDTPLRTPKEARAWLRSHGVSVCEFARRIGVSRHAVNDALRGRGKGTWGDAHLAAVALGMKAPPQGEPPFSLDAESPKARGAISTHAANAA